MKISWPPIIIAAVIFIAGIVGSYYSSQISIAEDLGKRPTREEVKEEIKGYHEQVKREVDDIKESQKETREDIRDIRQNIERFIQSQIERDRRPNQ